MLFIQKEAIYSHGLFWFGDSLDDAIDECNRLADIDIDSHHEYIVYEFGILNADKMIGEPNCWYGDVEHDPKHKSLYMTFKGDKERGER